MINTLAIDIAITPHPQGANNVQRHLRTMSWNQTLPGAHCRGHTAGVKVSQFWHGTGVAVSTWSAGGQNPRIDQARGDSQPTKATSRSDDSDECG
ncbi:MAG: hypothetical protein JWO57_1510 [Pseudonocardiales bacterium]|nr:hypothetical protein [Pseudonocardiales bacterium]